MGLDYETGFVYLYRFALATIEQENAVGAKGPPRGVRAIADSLGLSKATVSKAINDRPGVSPVTRRRVLRAVERLGYSPDRLAQALAWRRTWLLGLVIPIVRHGFFVEIARSVIDEATRDGYRVIFDYSDESPQRERRIVEDYLARCVDGLIICPCIRGSASLLKELCERRYPLALVDRNVPGIRAPFVSTDFERGGYLAAHALLRDGHERIAFLCGPASLPSTAERVAGIRRAMDEAKTETNSLLILEGAFDGSDVCARLRRLFRDAPDLTGIICGSLDIALAVRAELAAVGVRVPQDLSLVTFGGGILGTYIDQKAGAIGRHAARILLMQLREEAAGEDATGVLRVEPQLVAGDSTGPPRTGPLPRGVLDRLHAMQPSETDSASHGRALRKGDG